MNLIPDHRDHSTRLADPSFFTTPEFFQTLDWMRRTNSVQWVQAWPQRGFWAITSYDEVKKVLLDPVSFSSEKSGSSLPVDPEMLDKIDPAAYGLGIMPAFADPPRHDEVRRGLGRLFNAKVALSAAKCQEICERLVDHVITRGECEIVAELSAPVPAQVIFHVMGIPEDEWPQVASYIDRFFDAIRGGGTAPVEAMQESREALFAYVQRLVEARRASPGDDLVSQAINLQIKGVALSELEIVWNCWALIMAGFETSRNVISGGLVALIQHPEQMALLRNDPALINVAVDEMVRWTSPGQVLLRTATKDLELAGKSIRSGDWLTVWIASANRDENIFKDPHCFDIKRYPNPHLGFGFGIHNCIGRPIALLEVRTMITIILRRLKDIQISGPLDWVGTTVAMGLERGRVKFQPV